MLHDIKYVELRSYIGTNEILMWYSFIILVTKLIYIFLNIHINLIIFNPYLVYLA